MVKTRLIQAALLALVCLPSTRPPAGEAPDEVQDWDLFSERCASASLKTLATEDPGFRPNDRDWTVIDPTLAELAATMKDPRGCDGDGTRVADFWTFDVSGLYSAAFNPASCYAILVQFIRELASWAECFSW